MTHPNWAFEPVNIVDYDPMWPHLAAQETAQLHALLVPWLTGAIEHIGSTAIPGMAAKPILDLQAPIETLNATDEISQVLAPYEWHYVPPELDQRPLRRLLVKVIRHQRVAHLHLMCADAEQWHERLIFRDALRGDPDLARAYAKLKRQLSDQHRIDREAYTAGKAQFVKDVLNGRV